MAIVALAALLVLRAAFELALPRLLERRLAGHLTRHGGHARLELHAFPAARLLQRRGRSLKLRASGLALPPAEPAEDGARKTQGLEDLDGFESIDIQVVGMRIGPMSISRLTLVREGDEPYHARAEGTVTGSDLGTRLGMPGLLGALVPGSKVEIPVDVTADIESDGGRPRATAVSGSVAGLPAGAIVELITAAVASRI